MAVRRVEGDVQLSLPAVRLSAFRVSRYWLATRSLMLLWLALSLWQIGLYPLAEGDDEALGALMGFRLASATSDPVAIGLPFVQGRPFLSYLPTALTAHLLPVSDFTMRLPYALIGALQMPLLLGLTARGFGRRAALFAGLLALGSGVFAINRLTLGISVFITFELAGAALLMRYSQSGKRATLFGSIALFAAAMFTFYDGAVLLIAALAFAWWKRRETKDVRVAAIASFGALAIYAALSVVAVFLYAQWVAAPVNLAEMGALSHFVGRAGGIGLPGIGALQTWTIYLGAPVAALTLGGLAFALAFRQRRRNWQVGLVAALAVPHIVIWLFLTPRVEHVVFTAPLLFAVAGYGWAVFSARLGRPTLQKKAVTVFVVAGVVAGIGWSQAMFNSPEWTPQSFEQIKRYVAEGAFGHGIFGSYDDGVKTAAHVLRVESAAETPVFLTQGADGPLRLYSGMSFDTSDDLWQDLRDGKIDRAFVVRRGDDSALIDGPGGMAEVTARHMVTRDGVVLYQVAELRADGAEPQPTAWWPAEVYDDWLVSQNRSFADYLTPLIR